MERNYFSWVLNICILYIIYLILPIYHLMSNGQAELFVDTPKRALKKPKVLEAEENALQVYLNMYRMMQISQQKWHVHVIFAGKGKLSFDKLLPGNMKKVQQFQHAKSFMIGDKVFFKSSKAEKENWQKEKNIQRLGNIKYTVEGGQFRHQRQ